MRIAIESPELHVPMTNFGEFLDILKLINHHILLNLLLMLDAKIYSIDKMHY